MSSVCPHQWGSALSWWWGLWAPRILQIPLFRNPKRRRLLRVPQFGPQNPAMDVLKSPGTPLRASVHRAFWRYHYLQAFSGVDTGAPGIKSDWCIYGIRAVYGCLVV